MTASSATVHKICLEWTVRPVSRLPMPTNPRKAGIDEGRGLWIIGEQPQEIERRIHYRVRRFLFLPGTLAVVASHALQGGELVTAFWTRGQVIAQEQLLICVLFEMLAAARLSQSEQCGVRNGSKV